MQEFRTLSVGVRVAMPMMEIGIMTMPMHEWLMLMPMAVRFPWRGVHAVRVPMVLIVGMPVLVLHVLVRVLMVMTFREMQPQPDSHRTACHHQAHG